MVYLFKTYVDYNEVKVLLNENKVKMMTKMAIYEKNEGRRMLRTAKYFKGDYVAFGILKTLITTTFAFAIVAIMYVLHRDGARYCLLRLYRNRADNY